MKARHFPPTALAFTVCAIMHTAWADDTPSVELEPTYVNLEKTKPIKTVGATTLRHEQLNREMVQNSHDLVRYNTEVDVAEVGRYGNKGFAIRGVDGNRVAMNVDGMALPEVEINELFSPYGYMYEGRFNPDVEMMGSIGITTGADSVMAGSGAVGGSVSYNTKKPTDLVHGDKNLGGYAKLGYANKNEEMLSAFGVAGVYDRAEFLLNYARREGHELKNHNMRSHKKEELHNLAYIYSQEDMPTRLKSLLYPQSAKSTQDSVLAKLYFFPAYNHRIGVHGLYQNKETLMNTDTNASYGGRTSVNPRRAHDQEKMKTYGINYRHQPSSGVIDEWLVDYTHSDVLGVADTWLYSRSYSNPNSVSFSEREYRPTNTITDQYSMTVKFLPQDWSKFGKHQFTFKGGISNADRTTTAVVLKEDGTPNFAKYAFSDVKKDSYFLSLIDTFTLNNHLKGMAGVRYDNYQYKPYFQNNVFGFDENTQIHQTCAINGAKSGFCDAYRDGKHLKDTKFDHLTYSGALEYQPIDRLYVRYKVGTGFLAPTGTQIYRNFQGLGVLEVPNHHLKAETSINHELEFEFNPTKNTTLTVAGYVSNYDDFIHTKYWEGDTGGCNNMAICLQSTNLDNAKIHGVKIGAKANLSDKFNLQGNLNVHANYHTAKDQAWVETDHNGRLKINTLAATPASLILGADYMSANNDWSLHARMRGIRAKKAEDTKGIEIAPTYDTKTTICPPDIAYYGYCTYYGYYTKDEQGNYTKTDRVRTGYTEYVDTYKHANRSKEVLLVDIYGSKRFGKDNRFILNGGIYNLTNAKYVPWESLRMFGNANVNNMVDPDGHGFNRYTATGRNYALSLTYEF